MVSPFLIEEIFPAREVHVVCGPSGAGKSTWLFQLNQDLRLGTPVFGYASRPSSCCYLALDRSTESVIRTLERIGLRQGMCACSGTEMLPDKPNLTTVLNFARQHKAEVVFIDAFLRIVRGKSNDYNAVADFIASLTRLCQQQNLTIFGSTHTPKTRDQDGISDPRQKLIGSVAFAGMAETLVLIEPGDPSDVTDCHRTLTLMPRNVPSKTYQMLCVKEGLIPLLDEPADPVLDEELRKWTAPTLDRGVALEWGKKHGLSSRTVERWIEKRSGVLIQKLSRGKYGKLVIQ